MSDTFRELLKLVGSGSHTGKDLSREQAAAATRSMLQQTATPAQIGAFMIAHRIKRPTYLEMAGMVDAYRALGSQLQPLPGERIPLVFGIPYDGRTRTGCIAPITALILAEAGYPVIHHGGNRMPTKYGVCLVELWQALGVDWTQLALSQTQAAFERNLIGFVYQPRHFPAADALVPYRDQIGKRPPFATLELVWSPYAGAATTIAGYVHPPTEKLLQKTCAEVGGYHQFVAVKGLEGSCDLPRSRTGIISIDRLKGVEPERLLLHPRDFGMGGEELPCPEAAEWGELMGGVLHGEASEWLDASIWNGGFYLWLAGAVESISEGIAAAREAISSGKLNRHLETLKSELAALQAETAETTTAG